MYISVVAKKYWSLVEDCFDKFSKICKTSVSLKIVILRCNRVYFKNAMGLQCISFVDLIDLILLLDKFSVSVVEFLSFSLIHCTLQVISE